MKEVKMQNLPIDPKSLAQGLTQATQRAPDTSDVQFIKLEKGSGNWVFGADDTEDDGGEWAINPTSFVEGFIMWGDGELLGEEMAPMAGVPLMNGDLPDIDVSNVSDGGKWAKQVGFAMQCLTGENAGTIAAYKTSSKGGTKAVRRMVEQVVKAINNGPDIVPVVVLGSDFYKHKQWGKIYNPELKIKRWIAMDATSADVEELDEDEVPDHDEPEQAPTKKRRRVAQ